jgi:hypothetical protein
MTFIKNKSMETGGTCFGHDRDRQPANSEAGGLLLWERVG